MSETFPPSKFDKTVYGMWFEHDKVMSDAIQAAKDNPNAIVGVCFGQGICPVHRNMTVTDVKWLHDALNEITAYERLSTKRGLEQLEDAFEQSKADGRPSRVLAERLSVAVHPEVRGAYKQVAIRLMSEAHEFYNAFNGDSDESNRVRRAFGMKMDRSKSLELAT